MSLLNTKLLNDYEMPVGSPEEWDVIEEVQGHYLAREFARELLVDWDPERAMHRLEYYEADAAKKGRTIYKHGLVTQYLSEFMADFAKRNDVSEDTILSALWVEANDRSFGSSSKSRISALKALHSIIKPKVPEGRGGAPNGAGDEDMDSHGMTPLTITIRTAPVQAK